MPVSVNPGDDADVTGAAGASSNTHTGTKITTESLSTAAGATFTEVLTTTLLSAGSIPLVSVGLGTATTGMPVVANVSMNVGSGTVTVVIQNIHATAAFNGTLIIRVVIL